MTNHRLNRTPSSSSLALLLNRHQPMKINFLQTIHALVSRFTVLIERRVTRALALAASNRQFA